MGGAVIVAASWLACATAGVDTRTALYANSKGYQPGAYVGGGRRAVVGGGAR